MISPGRVAHAGPTRQRRARGQNRPSEPHADAPRRAILPTLLRQLLHQAVQRRLSFEPDAGPIGQPDKAVLDPGVIRKAAESSEHARIGFGAPEPETRRDGKRHLVAAMWKQLRPAPDR